MSARSYDICVDIIERELAEGLYGIGVEYDIRAVLPVVIPYGAAYRNDRLDGADLVVYRHDRDDNSVFVKCRLQHLFLHISVDIHVEEYDLKAVFLKSFACFKNSRMLHLCGDDLSAAASELARCREQRHVVALGAA